MKNVLFISWDGPQTSYMEGLFFPIFEEIQKQSNFQFHVIQFTWAGSEKLETVSKAAAKAGIKYTSTTISRKPIVSIGSFLTVLSGTKILKNYIKEHNISIVMPRSTFPAMMVNRLKKRAFKVVFDADGLPIDERVDFSGLSTQSLMYKFLKGEETKLLKSADTVITRSQQAIDIHLDTIGKSLKDKFFVVTNGRNTEHFKRDEEQRINIRKSMSLDKDSVLWVYCGSLGPQYGWEEMISIFKGFYKTNSNSHFLILTGNIEFAQTHLPETLQKVCTIKSVPFVEVPNYLSAADIAFAIRKPTYSMKGVAPIKLGEYILTGLPTIASKGIGDTEEILKHVPGNFLFNHEDPNNIENAVTFAESLNENKEEMRNAGLQFFSIEKSALSYLAAFKTIL